MHGLGIPEVLLLLLACVAFTSWIWARISHKAGFSRAWGFAAAVPLLNLIMIWVFAFSEWPAIPQGKEPPGDSEV